MVGIEEWTCLTFLSKIIIMIITLLIFSFIILFWVTTEQVYML